MRNNNLLILAIGLWATVALASCRKENQPDHTASTTPIQLGVAGFDDRQQTAGAASRATAGQILTNPSQLSGENIALYGVAEDFSSGVHYWASADRVINTLTAKLEAKPSSSSYIFNYGTSPAYYPAKGFLNIYSIYPSSGYVTITDDNTNAPTAAVELGIDFTSQYDVLHGYTEKLTVAQAQQAAVKFQHALAQLRIKIFRDADVTEHPTLTKVTVRGVNKATLASIERPDWTNSTQATDSSDFVAFEGSQPLTATSKETAQVLNSGAELMLLPGKNSINKITVTVDGNEFISYIPKEWNLLQGKVNTLTLHLKKMELRLEEQWQVTPWASGDGATADVENTGKMVQITAKLLDATGATKTDYNATPPTKADITLRGFTLKDVGVTFNQGVLTTDAVNSGSVNDNPIYLEGLTLYDGVGNILFDGKLEQGKLQSTDAVYIDVEDNGQLKKNNAQGAAIDLTMTFGGFGDGTAAAPYEVHSTFHLKNINNLLGVSNTLAVIGTNTSGAYFIQTDHIDFKGVNFTSIGNNATFYGNYNGNYKKLRNVNFKGTKNGGLFASVAKKRAVDGTGIISNVIIASGTITGTNNNSSYTGSVVGNLGTLGEVIRCENRADISSGGKLNAGTGGIVGQLTGARITRCANFGSISGANGFLGGIVGRVGQANDSIMYCYNAGEIISTYNGASTSSAVGGIGGFLSVNNGFKFGSSYNRGTITCTFAGIYAGTTIGQLSLISTPPTWYTNTYYLQDGTTTLPAIGQDNPNNPGLSNKMIGKTEAELKDAAMLIELGDEFKADFTTNPINDGYPILKWQQQQ